MRRRHAIALVLVAACEGGEAGRGLDAAHLPASAHGIVPGQATEAAVAAAWRDAPNPDRDQSLGGAGPVRLNDRPAIVFDLPGDGEAWLVAIDGEPRVARLVVPILDDCAAVVAAMGDRYKPDTCRFTNRKPDPGEHRGCARTPDGRHQISIDCHDRSRLEFWVHWDESTYQRVSMQRPSRR